MSASHPVAGLTPPPDWLIEDLKTDWIPDALGGFGADADRTGTSSDVLISTAGGDRLVPVTTLAFRFSASLTTHACLAELEASMPRNVCGYRDLTTPYRQEWRRAQTLADELFGTHQILHADIKNFFECIDGEHVARALGLPPALTRVLRQSQATHSVALISGHRWSRRLANVILRHVDRALTVEYVRWQDDYSIDMKDEDQAGTQLNRLTSAASELGLSVNAKKTFRSLHVKRGEFPDPALASPDERLRMFRTASHSTNTTAALKRVLRGYAETGDPTILGDMPELLRQKPFLAPRIAYYVASCFPKAEAVDALLDILFDANTIWVTGRFLAAAAHSRRAAAALASSGWETSQTGQDSAVSALRARVAHAAGEPWDAPNERLARALRLSYDDLRPALPLLDTTL